jgi:carboxyl-terminal processing protease
MLSNAPSTRRALILALLSFATICAAKGFAKDICCTSELVFILGIEIRLLKESKVQRVIVIVTLLIVTAAHMSFGERDMHQQSKLLEQVWTITEQRYLDPTFNGHDPSVIRHRFLDVQYASVEQEHAAAREILSLLGDPQTRYLSAEELTSTVEEFSGEIGSIGLADIWLVRDRKSGALRILHVIADSPALRSGVRPGDLIVGIDGMTTDKLDRDEVLMRSRGPIGTFVEFEIKRGHRQHLRLTLKREALMLRTVMFREVDAHGRKIGYVRLSQFAKHSAQQLGEALSSLSTNGVDGFVLDLRNNPGGFVPAAREIAGFFLTPNEVIYRSVDRTSKPQVFTTDQTQITTKPLVIIVNRATASAAEILAGALQQDHRATLVGTQTFGQGLIHSVQPLAGGSGLVIAVAHFETPSGSDIRGKGLTPERKAASGEIASHESLSRSDPQYRQALALLTAELG